MLGRTGTFSAGVAAGAAALHLSRRGNATRRPNADEAADPGPEYPPKDTFQRLKGFRRDRNIRCWVTVSVGTGVYIGWAYLLQLVAGLGDGPREASGSSFGPAVVAQWDLGLSPDIRTAIVPACLALVATLTIASMATAPTRSSKDSRRRMNRDDELNAVLATEVWLQTLTTAALLAAVLAVAMAASFVPGDGAVAVPFLACAWFSCWVASGLQVQTDERIKRAEQQAAIEREQSVVSHAEATTPGVVDYPLTTGLLLVYVLVGAVALLPTAPLLIHGLVVMGDSNYGVTDLLRAVAQWSGVFFPLGFLPLFFWAATAAHVAMQSPILAGVYRVAGWLSYAGGAWLLWHLVDGTSGDLVPSLWVGSALWLLMILTLALFPRMNPLTRFALSLQAKHAQRRLSRLTEKGMLRA